MREYSTPPVATIDDAATLTDAVWNNAELAPDAPQFARPGEPDLETDGSADVDGRADVDAGWEDVTCAQFRDEVVALARGLLAAGIEPGDRIALMSKTRYEWTLIDYAIWACGAVTVPIYETSSPEQVAWILADSGAVACFVETAEHRELVVGLREQVPALEHLWQIEPGGPTGKGAPRGAVVELVADGAAIAAEEVDTRRHTIGADDIATIIYTSGTTGRPKGCVLTHRNICSDVANSAPGLPSLFHEGNSTLLFLPLAHSFARLIQIGAVQIRVRLGHTADIKNLVGLLSTFKPDFVFSVPRVFEKVYNTAQQRARADGKGAIFGRAENVAIAYSRALDTGGPGLLLRAEHALFDRLVYEKLRAALGGRCRHSFSGGAPLGERLAHFFRGIGVTIYEGYGLTETSPASTGNMENALRLGTVGRPLPGVTVRVADDGEILIKGEHVFKRYWNNEAATAEAIDAEGWFHSGDLGELDDDGYLRITGRKKDLIVTAAGKNVAPSVLEEGLRGHSLISQAVVVGDQQPFIAVLVTIDEDSLVGWKREHDKPEAATAADLRGDPDLTTEIKRAVDQANRVVSKAEAIKVFRILPKDFTEAGGELTPSLKVKRNVVLKEYADEIAAIYSH